MLPRYLQTNILTDLQDKKMVFIMGPRQAGKTTLAQSFGDHPYKGFAYYNWDNASHRKMILQSTVPGEPTLLIYDEIHKYRLWKRYIKGIYDVYKEIHRMIITGSAHLRTYRKGGDSVMGRSFTYTLHPLSLAEVGGIKPSNTQPFQPLQFPAHHTETQNFASLQKFGGFPEPYLKASPTHWRRWQNERFDRFIKEDIRDLEPLRELSTMQVLAEILPQKIGSLLSLHNISEDLEVAFQTAARYVQILEEFYYLYRIYPYTSSKVRSLKKTPKAYLWDWSPITDDAIKFENMIASHLLKWSDYLHDVHGYKAKLFYLRDKDGREVDFLLTIDHKPWFAVEVKLQDTTPSHHLSYFAERLHIPYLYQVIQKPSVDILTNTVRVISADKFLLGLV